MKNLSGKNKKTMETKTNNSPENVTVPAEAMAPSVPLGLNESFEL